MTLLLKDPDAVLDYAVDWGAEYLDDDALAVSEWDVDPEEPGGVVVEGSRFDPKIASAIASGGVEGRIYRLSNRVVTISGREDSRSVLLRVEKR